MSIDSCMPTDLPTDGPFSTRYAVLDADAAFLDYLETVPDAEFAIWAEGLFGLRRWLPRGRTLRRRVDVGTLALLARGGATRLGRRQKVVLPSGQVARLHVARIVVGGATTDLAYDGKGLAWLLTKVTVPTPAAGAATLLEGLLTRSAQTSEWIALEALKDVSLVARMLKDVLHGGYVDRGWRDRLARNAERRGLARVGQLDAATDPQLVVVNAVGWAVVSGRGATTIALADATTGAALEVDGRGRFRSPVPPAAEPVVPSTPRVPRRPLTPVTLPAALGALRRVRTDTKR